MSVPSPTARRPLGAELVELVRRPSSTFPRLLDRADSPAAFIFPAVSGIFFAYEAAQALRLSDQVGFPAAVGLVIFVGAMLGVLALWFATVLPSWNAMLPGGGVRESTRMFAVFGYATWPFLPLLLIVIPIELALYGTRIFSEVRPSGPWPLVWLVRALELGTIFLWLALMIKGTAVARRETEEAAMRDIGRWTAEIIVIAVLLFLILVVSLAYW